MGVVHTAARAGDSGLFLLVHDLGAWQLVESGYQQMPCDELLTQDLSSDPGLPMDCG